MSSIFTIHIDVFYKLPLFREAIKAIQEQTYQNLEIIISNNGADQEITDFISETKTSDKRVKVIEYEENIFSYDDPLRYFYVLCNDALKIAEGDFYFYQSYDDLLSLDYVERMVRLFKENTECTSAAGISVNIDADGNVAEWTAMREDVAEDITNRNTNLRPRYMPGHEMALDCLNPKGGKMFSSPGTIFSFRKDALIKYGGFHRCVENSQLYGIVPFGITGFDEEAIFYWRRHGGQLNLELFKRGYTGRQEAYSLIDDFKIRERWSVFGEDVAQDVVSRMSSKIDEAAANCTTICLFTFSFKGAVRSFFDSCWNLDYWKALPKLIWYQKMVLVLSLLSTFQWLIQPFINVLNGLFPSKAPGSGTIQKIKKYYDMGSNPTSAIPYESSK